MCPINLILLKIAILASINITSNEYNEFYFWKNNIYLSPLNSCFDFSSKWQNSKTIFLSWSSLFSILTMPFTASKLSTDTKNWISINLIEIHARTLSLNLIWTDEEICRNKFEESMGCEQEVKRKTINYAHDGNNAAVAYVIWLHYRMRSSSIYLFERSQIQ